MAQPLTLHIQGMTCGGCARSVQRVLSADPAVLEVVQVSFEQGTAQLMVDPARLDRARIARAVDDAGYALREP